MTTNNTNNKTILLDCFKATREQGPADTVRALVDRIGYASAVVTVAELVNTVSASDGRIFGTVREWAQSTENARTREELREAGIFTPSEIHPAHIDQLGRAMMNHKQEAGEVLKVQAITEATTAEGLPLRGRVHLITKDGRRVCADLSGFKRAIIRRTNKRTGAPLKHSIIDSYDNNALHIDYYFHRVEYWEGATALYDAQYGANREQEAKAQGLHYVPADVLQIVNDLTGRNYTAIECNKEETKLANWEEIEEQERAEIINEEAEKKIRKAGELVAKFLAIGHNVPGFCYDEVKKAEALTGISEAEKRQALAIAERGGFRERSLALGEHRAITKTASTRKHTKEHNIITIWDILPDSCGVIHYCNIDLVTGQLV